MGLDTQLVELLGRQRLIAELVRDGLEVAVPVRDRGIDLIAYADLSRQVARFASRPIQMKAASAAAFVIDRKFEKIADLVVAYVWHLDNPSAAVTYALPYAQVLKVATEKGWITTASWQQGKYTVTKPGKELVEMLEPYRMGSGSWWQLVAGDQLLD